MLCNTFAYFVFSAGRPSAVLSGTWTLLIGEDGFKDRTDPLEFVHVFHETKVMTLGTLFTSFCEHK